MTDAIARHRRLAESARQAGDLATAATELRIVTLLAPDDAGYARELAAIRAALEREVREELQAGHAAMASGDLERAHAAMLKALALDPEQADAAKVLREIDRRRLTRIQADRAAKVRMEDTAATRAAATRNTATAAPPEPAANDAFDIEQAIEMLRAGDVAGGLRDLKAFAAANPGNRAARQRIGAAVAERARELEDQGAREQALALYEQAVSLRGDGNVAWAARIAPLRKALSHEYLEKGTRAYRTNLSQAISFLEISVRYDPGNAQASLKLKEARTAREKLDKIK